MRVCADCFNDIELSCNIEAVGVDGVCEVKGKNAKVVDLEDYSDFFSDIISCFCNAPLSNQSIYEVVQNDWNLFDDFDTAKIVLDKFIEEFGYGLDPLHVEYIDEISSYVSIWGRLKEEIKHKDRFFVNLSNYNPSDPTLEECLKIDGLIQKGELLFRARVIQDRAYNEGEMGAPPADKVSGGRANPIGIPYLYLCKDKETPLYEVRARYKDKVAIAEFRALKDLGIVDLSLQTSLYQSSTSGEFRIDTKHKLLLNAIAKDMSKPLSRYDSELEYVPTQYICELCRLNGADGISYRSSLHEEGMNLVLFDVEEANVKCTKVETVVVDHVKIDAHAV